MSRGNVTGFDLQTFVERCDRATQWPLPGGGQTRRRFELLAADACEDLVLGRLVEAHADAVATSIELGAAGTIRPGQRWGVWAAGPANSLTARHTDDGWQIAGEKRWCSGASFVTDALVDAVTTDGQQLFAIVVAGPRVEIAPPSWTGAGMARSDTRTVLFNAAPAVAVGRPGDYLSRPGFWAGAIGVAACWHGGTAAVAESLLRAAAESEDPHLLSHLGAVHAALLENRSVLSVAACELDDAPTKSGAMLARSVRATVERNAVEIMDRVGRALGPRPLAHDRRHSETVADLTVYIRQHHAERDLESLGRDVVEASPRWCILPSPELS
jgi:alkylation response protein AidB-like acyl-CoA dehydrogenase